MAVPQVVAVPLVAGDMKLKLFILSILALCSLGARSASAYYSLPKPTGYLTDLATYRESTTTGIFTPTEHIGLGRVLAKLERETGVEFAVVIVPSLKGDTIENFSEKLFKEWGIGKKGKDNGLLLLIVCCEQGRTARLEVGYGLEGVIPDITAKNLIEGLFSFASMEGYNVSLVRRVSRIVELLHQEVLYSPQDISIRDPFSYTSIDYLKWFIYFLLFNIVSAFVVTRLKLGALWWFGGLIGAVLGYFTLGWLGAGLVGLVGLLVDLLVNKKFGLRGAGVDGFVGGVGSGSTPGGFGGFGGGRSGGGGASLR